MNVSGLLAALGAMILSATNAQAAPEEGPDMAVPRPIAGQLSNGAALMDFLQRLPPRAGDALSIVQIGDSHTAGRMFTGGWRSAWQAQYGAGGRGLMAVGKPYAGYLTLGVTTAQSKGWRTASLFGKTYQPEGPAIGLSGFTLTSVSAGETAEISADAPEFHFDRFSLCGLSGPDQGDVRILMGSEVRQLSFAAPASGVACFDVDAPQLVSSVRVESLDTKPVSLTSWSTHRRQGGITLSNLGVVGAQLAHFARNDDRVVAAELQHLRPDLLVVAYGTNEGFAKTLDLAAAEAILIAQVARLRRLLGYNVPVLLLGPPDVLRAAPVAKLTTAPDAMTVPACANGGQVPENVTRMRDMQRNVAQNQGWAFWDWQGAMGGPCASEQWVAAGLQMKDHIHLTASGGQILGKALADDLDRAKSLKTAPGAQDRPNLPNILE